MQPKTKTILFIVLSFILGVLAGWFIEYRVIAKPPHTSSDFQKLLTERLHLTGPQIAQVDSILETRRLKMNIYRKQMLTMRDTTQIEIRKVLNDDQNKLFDDIIREINEREAKRRDSESTRR